MLAEKKPPVKRRQAVSYSIFPRESTASTVVAQLVAKRTTVRSRSSGSKREKATFSASASSRSFSSTTNC